MDLNKSNSFNNTNSLKNMFKNLLKTNEEFRKKVNKDWNAVYDDVTGGNNNYEMCYQIIINDYNHRKQELTAEDFNSKILDPDLDYHRETTNFFVSPDCRDVNKLIETDNLTEELISERLKILDSTQEGPGRSHLNDR